LHPLSLIVGPGGYMKPPPKQVISSKTARQIRHMLDGVVSQAGTAAAANIIGYSEGGKTGTARIAANGGYSDKNRYAMFVGMAPIKDPELVTLVMISNPQAGEYYASQVAAPVFADIMRQALRVLHVPPTWPRRLIANKDDAEVSS